MDAINTGYRFDEADHIHWKGDLPLHGTTTVLDVLGKPLTWWASGMACKQLGWLNPKENSDEECDRTALEMLGKIVRMSLSEFQALLSKAYRAHATELKDSAKKGTSLHEMVEEWVKWKIGVGPQPLFVASEIQPFVKWAEENVDQFLMSEKCVYSTQLWVGGKFDILYRDKRGRVILGDIKSAKAAYFSHFVQMGAYRIQYEENGLFEDNGDRICGPAGLGKISGYAVFPMGKPEFKGPDFTERVDEYSKAFESALMVYKIKKKFEEGKI